MPIHLKLTFSNSKMYAVTQVYLSRMEVDLPSTGLVYSMPRLVENQNGHGRGECPGICPLSSELHKMEDQAEACCLNLREMSSELKKVNAQTTGSCLNLGQISIELARVNEEGGCFSLGRISSELQRVHKQTDWRNLSPVSLELKLVECERSGCEHCREISSQLAQMTQEQRSCLNLDQIRLELERLRC